MAEMSKHSPAHEAALIGCLLQSSEEFDVLAQALAFGITHDTFYIKDHRLSARLIFEIYGEGRQPDPATLFDRLIALKLKSEKEAGRLVSELTLDPSFPTDVTRTVNPLGWQVFARRVLDDHKSRESARLYDLLRTADEHDAPGIAARLFELHASSPKTSVNDKLRERLATRRFNFAAPPVEPTPRFFINGRPVCTPGNLTNIIAQAKAGKTALIAASIAAAIVADAGGEDRDTLGITASNPGKMKLVQIDTEQSPFDHDQLIRRALRRAGVSEPPPSLLSFGLAGFSAAELRQSLKLLLADAAADGGIFAVIIDGTADLVNDVNDAEECNAFVAELHNLAIEHRCPILNVVHENPGQDGGKMRGHLGSQLERKAESNIRLKKTDEITVVFSEKMRKAPILEREGPRFQWSDEAGMHVSVESAGAVRDTAQVAELRDLADEVLNTGRLRYVDVISGIEKARRVAAKTAEKRFSAMKKAGIITKDGFGFWSVSQVIQEAAA